MMMMMMNLTIENNNPAYPVEKISRTEGVCGFRRRPMVMKAMKTCKSTRVEESGSQTCPDGNNDESGRNGVTKQQAEARSKEEKTTEKSNSLRF